MSSIEFTAGAEWWISRTDGDGAQRHPAAINVGGGSVYDTVRYVPERTCRNLGGEDGTNFEHYDFGCSECGFAADVAEPVYCPNCGAKVVGDE